MEVSELIARYEDKDLLRLLTAGSVDDGKSTLIGRLLYEAGQYVYKQGAKGKLWDAIVALGNAATYRETAAEPHYYMGLAYEKKDKDEYDNAIAAYEKALTLEPNGPKAAICKKKIRDLKKHKEKMDKFWGRKR